MGDAILSIREKNQRLLAVIIRFVLGIAVVICSVDTTTPAKKVATAEVLKRRFSERSSVVLMERIPK